MTVIIIAGGIDLAAGTALALSATVLAWFLNKGYSPRVSVVGRHRHRLPDRVHQWRTGQRAARGAHSSSRSAR